MSAILDALRKLDREKSLRRGTTPDIGAEILTPGLPRSGKRTALYLVLVCIVTAGITYAVLMRFDVHPKSSPPAAGLADRPNQPALPLPSPPPSESTSSRSASVQTPSSVSQPAPVQKASFPASLKSPSPRREVSPSPSDSFPAAESLSPPVTHLPGSIQQASPPPQLQETVQDLPDAQGGAAPKTHRTLEPNAPATSGGEKKAAQQVFTEPAPEVSRGAEKPLRAVRSESPADPPALRISGIVWSEDPSQRVAVINGTPLSEGDSIEGVKVVQILPTRVRFLQNASPFEILLGSAAVIRY